MACPNARLNYKVTTMSDAAELASRIEALEIQIAHQDSTTEALNQALTAQWQQIDALTRQMTQLTDRIAAAEQSLPAAPGNEPPPLYRKFCISQHRQMTRLPPARERLVDLRDLGGTQRQSTCPGVVGCMCGRRRFWNRHHGWRAGENRQRHLTRGRAMCIGNLLQHQPAFGFRRRKIIVPKRRISRHRDAMRLAPWDHRMLDGALLQMIKHLIAGDVALACNVINLLQIVGIEIADAP